MKTFSYETTLRLELEKALKKMVDEGRPFVFSKKIAPDYEWYQIKVKFADVETAEGLWNDLNRECNYAFLFGYRR